MQTKTRSVLNSSHSFCHIVTIPTDHRLTLFPSLCSAAAAVFNPDRALLAVAADGGLYPAPLAASQPSGPQLLALAGLVLGKAMYEGVLLNAPLAPFFVARLQGLLPTLDGLAGLDPEVHRGLTTLKR